MKVEAQMAALRECGITLRDGITIDDLLRDWTREEMERDSFGVLLCAMGAEHGPDYLVRRSGQLCHIDPECIEDHGAYVRLARDVVEIMQGELPLKKLSDEVDIESHIARLQFELDDRLYRWELEVMNDWMDTTFYERFAALIAARGCNRRLVYLDAGGQDFFIAAIDPARLERLRQLTGRDWQLIGAIAASPQSASGGVLQRLKSAWAGIWKRS